MNFMLPAVILDVWHVKLWRIVGVGSITRDPMGFAPGHVFAECRTRIAFMMKYVRLIHAREVVVKAHDVWLASMCVFQPNRLNIKTEMARPKRW